MYVDNMRDAKKVLDYEQIQFRSIAHTEAIYVHTYISKEKGGI
jgi:hypothetical protein